MEVYILVLGSQSEFEGETFPTAGPLNIGLGAVFLVRKIVTAQQVVSLQGLVVIEYIVVALGDGVAITQTEREFAIFAIGAVVANVGTDVVVSVVVEIGFVVVGICSGGCGGVEKTDEVIFAGAVAVVFVETGADVVADLNELVDMFIDRI